jgi:DNA-binding response OmpR family regulator
MPLRLLLSVGADPELMKIRSLILLNAGYAVRDATSVRQALKVFEAGDFDLVLICHSIREQERLQLIEAIRVTSSSAKIIVIRQTTANSAVLADETVHSLDGPEALLNAVAHTLAARRYSK